MVENIWQKIVGENIWWEIFSGKFVVENIWKKGVGPVDSGGRVDWEGTIFLTRPTEAPMPVYIIRLLTWPTEEEKFTVTSTIINQPSNIVQSASGRWTEADICNSVQNILCARYTIPSPTPSIISVINLTKTYLKAGSIRNSLKFIHINSFRILD